MAFHAQAAPIAAEIPPPENANPVDILFLLLFHKETPSAIFYEECNIIHD